MTRKSIDRQLRINRSIDTSLMSFMDWCTDPPPLGKYLESTEPCFRSSLLLALIGLALLPDGSFCEMQSLIFCHLSMYIVCQVIYKWLSRMNQTRYLNFRTVNKVQRFRLQKQHRCWAKNDDGSKLFLTAKIPMILNLDIFA